MASTTGAAEGEGMLREPAPGKGGPLRWHPLLAPCSRASDWRPLLRHEYVRHMPCRGEGVAATDRADLRLRRGELEDRDVRALASWLARVHERAPREHRQDALDACAEQLAADVRGIETTLPELAADPLPRIAQGQRDFLAAHGARLVARQREGHVRAALGPPCGLHDLCLGEDGWAVCTATPPASRARLPRDVCLDVANLALDLSCGERADLAERLLSSYAGAADDFSLYGVVDYFECACALARAARIGRDGAAPDTARRLLLTALAARARPLRPPVLVVVGGQVASGKSTVARALAARLAAPRIEADRIRDFLLGDRPGRTVHESQWARSFEPGFEQEVYDEVLRRAAFALDSGRPLVIDACFSRARQRADARALARRCGRPFLFVECRAQPAALRTPSRRSRPRGRRLGGDPSGAGGAVGTHRRPGCGGARGARHQPAAAGDRGRARRTRAALVDVARGDERRDERRERPRREPAVTFDCWNTLVYEDDWPAAHRLRVAALARAAREAGRIVPFEDAGRAFDLAWERHMHLWRQGVARGA